MAVAVVSAGLAVAVYHMEESPVLKVAADAVAMRDHLEMQRCLVLPMELLRLFPLFLHLSLGW
jgi:hypothetical protein